MRVNACRDVVVAPRRCMSFCVYVSICVKACLRARVDACRCEPCVSACAVDEATPIHSFTHSFTRSHTCLRVDTPKMRVCVLLCVCACVLIHIDAHALLIDPQGRVDVGSDLEQVSTHIDSCRHATTRQPTRTHLPTCNDILQHANGTLTTPINTRIDTDRHATT